MHLKVGMGNEDPLLGDVSFHHPGTVCKERR
jgi:hypothetical protein